MKKSDVAIGATYVAKVSGRLARVRIDRESSHGGWEATNAETGRAVRIKSAQRLRYPAGNGTGRKPSPVAPEATVESDAAEPDDAGEHEEFDPDVCATVGCDAAAALTYLGRPRCQACYEDDVQDNDEATDGQTDSPTTNEGAESARKESDMATKKTTRKGAKKATKRSPKAAKSAKATKPKAARKPAADATPKRISALDAAATVLQKAGEPMNAKAIIAAMAEQGLWTSPNGKTPHATLYAAILREIGTKGGEARFRKADRGLFEYVGGDA